jgi:ribosomal protein L29
MGPPRRRGRKITDQDLKKEIEALKKENKALRQKNANEVEALKEELKNALKAVEIQGMRSILCLYFSLC